MSKNINESLRLSEAGAYLEKCMDINDWENASEMLELINKLYRKKFELYRIKKFRDKITSWFSKKF